MGAHRVPDAQGGVDEMIGQFFSGGNTGEARGEGTQRKSKSGNTAVVAGDEHLIFLYAADCCYEPENAPLQRVSRVPVVERLVALVNADGEHAGVFARAVAVDGTRLLAATDQLCVRGFVHRRVYAALEVGFGEPGLFQDGSDGGEMRLLGIVRGAGDGKLLIRKAERIGGPGEDERECLKGFGRGAEVDVRFGVAQGFEHVAPGITGGKAAAVDALDQL